MGSVVSRQNAMLEFYSPELQNMMLFRNRAIADVINSDDVILDRVRP